MDPIDLALLAPAKQCNQACPRCVITEVFREPVRQFDLGPGDYVRFVSDFVDAGLEVRSASFLGYEPTLPESWPYVEAVFAYAKKTGIRRSLVTNGMLLSKREERLRDLDPHQIAVSFDGASAEVHDQKRGLPGAFETSLASLRRFLRNAPDLANRVEVTSTLFDERNVESLLRMPALLRGLGIRHWLLSLALSRDGDRVEHVAITDARRWLIALVSEARRVGVRPTAVELGTLFDNVDGLHVVRSRSLGRLFRLDPTGAIRTGDELMEIYDPVNVAHWNPKLGSAVDALGLRTPAQPPNETIPRPSLTCS